MRTVTIFVLLLFAARDARAQDAPPAPPAVDTAISRGLGFLARDAVAWRDEHHCVSCHHAAHIVWAMREAKARRHAVDEPLLAELTKWVAEAGDGRTGVPRPEGIPKALNVKAVLFALALEADPEPDAVSKTGLAKMLETVKSDQTENGKWASWPETRPPIFGNSDDSMTALATLALLPAAAAGDEAAIAARDRGMAWLAETNSDNDAQSIAMRLVLWRRAGRPEAEWRPLVEKIRAQQKEDGGWSQTTEMPGDAWATGQALYALASAGVSRNDPAVARGAAYLVRTQRDDGSWPMTSRPTKPGSAGSMSLIPITGAGSAWAVLGLVQ